MAERKKVGYIERGDIAVTGAYALNAKYIIHTVGPVWVDGVHIFFVFYLTQAEIQEYPHLLTLLKFLAQDNKFTYVASGSLLGVTLSQTTSIPMGSIRKVRMFPLDFEEFLYANGMNEIVIASMH